MPIQGTSATAKGIFTQAQVKKPVYLVRNLPQGPSQLSKQMQYTENLQGSVLQDFIQLIKSLPPPSKLDITGGAVGKNLNKYG